MHGTGDDSPVQRGHHAGHAGDDAGKQNHGDTVAHTELIALLAQPHQETGAGHPGDHNHQGHPDAVLGEHALAVKAVSEDEVVAQSLEEGDANGGVAGDGLELLLALLAAFPLETLQGGDGHGQQLDDNGAVDIGLDTQGKDRRLGKGAAAHHVIQAQDGGAHALEIGAEGVSVHIGDRDGAADAVNDQNQQREEDLLAKLRDTPGLANGLDHITSPPPFHPPPRLPPERTWKMRKPVL